MPGSSWALGKDLLHPLSPSAPSECLDVSRSAIVLPKAPGVCEHAWWLAAPSSLNLCGDQAGPNSTQGLPCSGGAAQSDRPMSQTRMVHHENGKPNAGTTLDSGEG